MKYKAGDRVTIVLDETTAHCANIGYQISHNTDQIIDHEPAPFDWKDVRPGMAFKTIHPSGGRGEIVWYIGPCWSAPHAVVISDYKYITCSDQIYFNDKDWLTRAPEHDIEVK